MKMKNMKFRLALDSLKYRDPKEDLYIYEWDVPDIVRHFSESKGKKNDPTYSLNFAKNYFKTMKKTQPKKNYINLKKAIEELEKIVKKS